MLHLSMYLALLYYYNCDHKFCEFGIFNYQWTTNFQMFGHEKFTALTIIQEHSIYSSCNENSTKTLKQQLNNI